jgi:SAM-dependent methyltransferase
MAEEAESKLAYRIEFFDAFAGAILGHRHAIHQVLELGSGPGFLADYILSRCPAIDEYTLLDFSPAMLQLSRERLRSFGNRVGLLGTQRRCGIDSACSPHWHGSGYQRDDKKEEHHRDVHPYRARRRSVRQ